MIIAEPPFGLRVDRETTLLDPRLRFGIPPRSSGDSYWLQHVVAHLAPGGIGYILTSPGMLFAAAQRPGSGGICCSAVGCKLS